MPIFKKKIVVFENVNILIFKVLYNDYCWDDFDNLAYYPF